MNLSDLKIIEVKTKISNLKGTEIGPLIYEEGF